jgi:hypothetical protein
VAPGFLWAEAGGFIGLSIFDGIYHGFDGIYHGFDGIYNGIATFGLQ